jgi:hypothetical protein
VEQTFWSFDEGAVYLRLDRTGRVVWKTYTPAHNKLWARVRELVER